MPNRAAVMTGLETIEIQDVPEPVPEPHQAVVRIEAVGVCGSDTGYYKVGRIGDYVVTGPMILGHEVAGQVIEVGADVTDVTVGDRVAIEPGTPCRHCHECLAGRYHLCGDLEFFATPPYDGALVQRLATDARNLYLLPDSMSYEQGAMVEPLSVGIWGCKRAGLQAGDEVLVTGAGPVGLLAASVARAFGALSVTVTDVSPFRLDLAAKLGFETEHAEEPTGRTFEVLLECSGAPGALAGGLRRLKPAGRAAMIGMSKEDAIALPLAQLNPAEITISLVNRYNGTWPLAIALIASGRVDVEPLVTHHFGLDETAEALVLGSRVPDSVKAVIHPQQ
ncbi:MAG: NAD(P)-dependent alcohol dehydrogenase [Janthinobacterium lividum]